MSSPPPSAGAPPPRKKGAWYSYWPKWRKVMMAGAVVLLVGSIATAAMGEGSRPLWLSNVTIVLGYGFLAWGFLLAMRARDEARKQAAADKKAEEGGEV